MSEVLTNARKKDAAKSHVFLNDVLYFDTERQVLQCIVWFCKFWDRTTPTAKADSMQV